MTVSITLEHCSRMIGDKTVLAPLNLHIPAGETLVLLGPSGCGKTTLLRLIAGLDTPAPGSRIRFGDRDVTALPIERRNVGMVFQNYALFNHMTVARNVAYGLKVRKHPPAEIRARTREMLAMMSLEDLSARPVTSLSGGQKQRVALARAIAPRPDVLLLDEPLSALDASLRDTLRAGIDSTLRSLGTTAIYVSHDQPEAMMLADRIAILNAGRIEQVGTAEALWRCPASPFVATFFGGGMLLPATRTESSLLVGDAVLPWPGTDTPSGPVFLLLRADGAELVPDSLPGTLPVQVCGARFLGDRTRLDLRHGKTAFSITAPPECPAPIGPASLRIFPERCPLLARTSP